MIRSAVAAAIAVSKDDSEDGVVVLGIKVSACNRQKEVLLSYFFHWFCCHHCRPVCDLFLLQIPNSSNTIKGTLH